MSNEKNREILNDVTAKLIDSCKGYKMCADASEGNLILKSQFIQRESARKELVEEFQSKIALYGGEIEQDGTIAGSFHRGYTKFVSLFKDDASAAIDALDDGEEHLAEYIQDQMNQQGLSADTNALLRKAHASAIEGERFADLLDD